MGESQIAGAWTRSERELHQCTGAQGGKIGPQSQGHHVLIATDNTTVVAYINKQGGTHFHLLLQMVSGSVSVATDSGHNSKSQTHSGLPKCDSRPVISAEPGHHDRV